MNSEKIPEHKCVVSDDKKIVHRLEYDKERAYWELRKTALCDICRKPFSFGRVPYENMEFIITKEIDKDYSYPRDKVVIKLTDKDLYDRHLTVDSNTIDIFFYAIEDKQLDICSRKAERHHDDDECRECGC